MRIIAGDKRGLRLKTLEGFETRPTLERVKEGMFSSMQFALPGAKVLDLYAGSGQLGLEALSRGASNCIFVDENREAISLIKENVSHVGYNEKCDVLCMNTEAFLGRTNDVFDVILLDPPYSKGVLPNILAVIAKIAAPSAFVLCESEPKVVFPPEINGLCLQKQYHYGTVMVTKYKKIEV